MSGFAVFTNVCSFGRQYRYCLVFAAHTCGASDLGCSNEYTTRPALQTKKIIPKARKMFGATCMANFLTTSKLCCHFVRQKSRVTLSIPFLP